MFLTGRLHFINVKRLYFLMNVFENKDRDDAKEPGLRRKVVEMRQRTNVVKELQVCEVK